MEARIPELALVVLVGPSGAGKSTFAGRHFRPTEIISSDQCRGMVADDEGDQSATADAFEVLHLIAARRLTRGLLTVVDATSITPEARRSLVALARHHHVPPVALVLDLPEEVCQQRNRARPQRQLPAGVVQRHHQQLQRSLHSLKAEGFSRVCVLRSVADVDAAVVVREPLASNRKTETGPLDIIGDVHGCHDELLELLAALGYVIEDGGIRHPQGRKAVFLGDLVDRGPRTPDVLRLVMRSVSLGTACCVAGNHDSKLVRRLRGHNVSLTHGLALSVEQLAAESPEFRSEVAGFLDRLASHYVFDGGRLVVAHAGLKEELQGRSSGAVRAFALYGETTGGTDERGLPVRGNWAAGYHGHAAVVYGHTPVSEPRWLNNTLCIDTGCVFGGRLTALRYPERALVSVPARRVHFEPARPLPPAG